MSDSITLWAPNDKVKNAAALLRDKFTDYDDEPPDVSVFEDAVRLWLQLIVDDVLAEADFHAYKPQSHLTLEWDRAIDAALHPVKR